MTTTELTVSQMIRTQLGGRFIAMTGARDFVGDHDALTFRLPQGRARWVKVALNAQDEYDITFYNRHAAVMHAMRNIGVEQLAEVIGTFCQLDTRL